VFTLEVGRWKEFLCPRLFGQLFDSVTKKCMSGNKAVCFTG